MSDQDKTRTGTGGAHPSPSTIANVTSAPPDVIVRSPHDATVMSSAASPVATGLGTQPSRRTMVGVAANKVLDATAAGRPHVMPRPQPAPKPPTPPAGGTPQPGAAP